MIILILSEAIYREYLFKFYKILSQPVIWANFVVKIRVQELQ